jgi:hypothetical protein
MVVVLSVKLTFVKRGGVGNDGTPPAQMMYITNKFICKST